MKNFFVIQEQKVTEIKVTQNLDNSTIRILYYGKTSFIVLSHNWFL